MKSIIANVETTSRTMTVTGYVGHALSEYLGAVVREARRSHKLTQQEVAQRAGVSYGFVNRMEHGHFESLKKYLDVLNAIDGELRSSFKLEMVPNEEVLA